MQVRADGLMALKRHKKLFTAQQYRSLKGQILSGNALEAKAALDRVNYQIRQEQNSRKTR